MPSLLFGSLGQMSVFVHVLGNLFLKVFLETNLTNTIVEKENKWPVSGYKLVEI